MCICHSHWLLFGVRDHKAKKRKLHAEESSEWERLMEEDGPPDEIDERPMRYNSGDEWEERLREEGAAGEDADEWGWSRCQSWGATQPSSCSSECGFLSLTSSPPWQGRPPLHLLYWTAPYQQLQLRCCPSVLSPTLMGPGDGAHHVSQRGVSAAAALCLGSTFG